LTEEKKKAHIEFHPSKGTARWKKSLELGENIISIALGSRFSAVATSKNYIRFFAPGGMEFFVLGSSNVVALAAYENVVAILYHGSLPFSGQQSLKIKVFDTITLRMAFDTPITLSENSSVKWFGFSSQGNLFFQDSNYTLWAYMSISVWTPVFESKSPIWIVGIFENSLYGIRLGYGEEEPNPLANHTPKKHDLKIPLTTPDYSIAAMGMIQREQMIFRKDVWGHMAKCMINDVMDHERSQMPDQKDINKTSMDLDKLKVNLVREALMKNDEEKAIWIALQIQKPKVFELCCQLVARLDKPMFLDKIRTIYQKFGAAHFFSRQEQNSAYSYQVFRDITKVNFLSKILYREF